MERREFRSKLEDLMPAEELLFEPTPGFGEFYKPYLEHAVAHPAKMNTWLLEFLIRAFTEPGDTVLDPMAGSGSTGIVAALHGRNAIQVELERKFWEWMEKAKENVEKHPALTPKGRIVNICGDARRLSELLGNADVAITSPPYTNAAVENPNVWKYRKGGKFAEEKVDACLTSPPYAETYTGGGDPEKRKERLIKAGHNPKDFLGGKARNAVLKHYGEVDVCLTSPPYSDAISKQGGPTRVKNVGVSTITAREYSQNPSNIGNLPLGEISAIITSPPYGEAQEGSGIAKRGYQGNKHSPTDLVGKRSYMPDKFENPENISRLPLGKIDTIITSPPYQNALHDSMEKREAWESKKIYDAKKGLPVGYSENSDNIGNIKEHGSIDVILTSPPYADGKKAGEVKPEEVEKYAKRWEENVEKRKWNSWGKSFHTPGRLKGIQSLRDGYSKSKENIGNLPFVDTVITSPPYGEAMQERGGTQHKFEKEKKIGVHYSHTKTNIGNLPLGNVDCCITSPPYEGSLEGTTRHTRGGIASRDPALAQTGSYATVMSFGVPVGYSANNDNIGNLKSSDEEYEALANGLMKNGKPTYLSEMLKVYGEMFKVLKPGGLAIIVVKPFIRKKKPVDLPYHTWLLMAKVGFRLAKLYKLRLKQQSFWRILQYQNFPDVPLLSHEYVLVCQKPSLEPKEVKPKVDPLDFLIEATTRKRVMRTFF